MIDCTCRRSRCSVSTRRAIRAAAVLVPATWNRRAAPGAGGPPSPAPAPPSRQDAAGSRDALAYDKSDFVFGDDGRRRRSQHRASPRSSTRSRTPRRPRRDGTTLGEHTGVAPDPPRRSEHQPSAQPRRRHHRFVGVERADEETRLATMRLIEGRHPPRRRQRAKCWGRRTRTGQGRRVAAGPTANDELDDRQARAGEVRGSPRLRHQRCSQRRVLRADDRGGRDAPVRRRRLEPAIQQVLAAQGVQRPAAARREDARDPHEAE